MSQEVTSSVTYTTLESQLAERTASTYTWNAPEIFDLSERHNRSEVEQRLRTGSISRVQDSVLAIANDLFEYENPAQKASTPENDISRAEFISSIVERGAAYGKWVHFPWSHELVRYPDRADHRNLRTSRNRNLITAAEQHTLYDSTVAVFGLSVGSNIVEKLVSLGVGGKIVLGDPDSIEPSNLNRINGGFTDVGTKKIDHMACKISEIDPYIEQVHFYEGISHSSVGRLAAARPNIIFDEVDDLPAKALMRQFARDHEIPLVMATDLGDRSIIDVERHDAEKVKPFNGRLKEQEFNALTTGAVTDKDIAKFTLKIVGLRHVTTRMLQSVMEKDKTLAGLPQLGVTASLGGALSAIAVREILLGRELPSGRYVCSPKKVLRLQPQASMAQGLQTVSAFVKSRK